MSCGHPPEVFMLPHRHSASGAFLSVPALLVADSTDTLVAKPVYTPSIDGFIIGAIIGTLAALLLIAAANWAAKRYHVS